ncbi:MAG: tRNA (adenosine(37)-N6)-dimethylallyltransferase MiaA [Bdellovibrionales bacterium]|nr:tRNA (adenosine(37)-N6)-dimethylallyltransferase MiaA [Bdellovibrionales bacterium]
MEETAKIPIIVTGPTGCGKTEISLFLARELGAHIVNIDSVQLYRDCDIGSARVRSEEAGEVPHHLLGIYDPGPRNNVHDYLVRTHQVLEQLRTSNTPVIFVGGSTLYIKLLLQGLVPGDSPNEVRRKTLEAADIEYLRKEASQYLASEELSRFLNDRIRLVRIIEKGEQKLDDDDLGIPGLSHALVLVLTWPREELYQRINLRTQRMLEAGLVGETKNLIENYGKDATPLDSIGYSQVCKCLAGELDEGNLAEEIAKATRNYAKRQMNFWRNEPNKCGWQLMHDSSSILEKRKAPLGRQTQIDIAGDELDRHELLALVQSRSGRGVEVQYLNPKRLVV